MSGKAKGNKDGVTIVIRKEEGGEHGHHGGAWKVAYADFVTAMMAFFLLMWLLNATTEEQRRGLADYFSPPNLLGRTVSGSGQPFGGRTAHDDGNMTSTQGAVRLEPGQRPVNMDIEEDDSETPAAPRPTRDGPPGEHDEESRTVARVPPGAFVGAEPPRGGPAQLPAPEPGQSPDADARQISEEALREELARREREAFERAAEQIREAVRSDPALADLARQLLVEHVPEGLRIQLLDAERQPMFALGSAGANDRARALLVRVAQVIQRLPNAIAITGHTDATPFRGTGSNWDLSADRANATRRLLTEAGVAEARMRSVSGMADRDLLIADQPTAAGNRRVSITLIRQVPESGPAALPAAAPPPASPATATPAPATPSPATPPAMPAVVTPRGPAR
jgi:chemotaxis protein MotB